MAERFNLTAALYLEREIRGLSTVKKDLDRLFKPYHIQLKTDNRLLHAQLAGVRTELESIKALANSIGKTNIRASSTNTTRVIQQQTSAIQQATIANKSFADSILAVGKRYAFFILGAQGVLQALNRFKQGFADANTFEVEQVKLAQILEISTDAVKGLGKEIISTNKQFGGSSSGLNQFSADLASAGFSVEQITGLLKVASQVQLSPNFEFSQLGSTVILLQKFSSETTDIIQNLNTINALAAKFPSEAKSVQATLSKAGAVALQRGISFNDLAALSTGLRSQSRQSDSVVANSLKSLISKLSTDTNIDILESLGVQSVDKSTGELRNFVDIIEDLQRASERFAQSPGGRLLFQQKLTDVAGVFQIGSLQALLQSTDTIRKAQQVAGNSSDSLEKGAEKAQTTLQNQIEKTKASFLDLFTTLQSDSGLRGFVDLSLKGASGLAQMTKELKNLLPLLVSVGAVLTGKSLIGALGKGKGFGAIEIGAGLGAIGLARLSKSFEGDTFKKTTGIDPDTLSNAVSGGVAGHFGSRALGLGTAAGGIVGVAGAIYAVLANKIEQDLAKELTEEENYAKVPPQIQAKLEQRQKEFAAAELKARVISAPTQLSRFANRTRNLVDNAPLPLQDFRAPQATQIRGLDSVGSKNFFSSIGQLGINKNQQKDLSDIGRTTNLLPKILKGTEFGGDNFTDTIINQLKRANIGDKVTEQIQKQLETLSADEFEESLNDVSGFSRKLLSAFDATTSEAQQLGSALNDLRQNELSNLENVFNALEKSRQSQLSSSNAGLDLIDLLNKQNKRPLDTNSGERELLQITGGNARELSNILDGVIQDFQRTKDSRLGLVANDLASKLSLLTDSTQRLRNIQEALSDIEQKRSGRENFATAFFSADFNGRRELEQGQASANIAKDIGLNNLLQGQQQQAVQFLSGPGQSLQFGKQTGQELLSDLLHEAKPELFRDLDRQQKRLENKRTERQQDIGIAHSALANLDLTAYSQLALQLPTHSQALINFTNAINTMPRNIDFNGNIGVQVQVHGLEAMQAMSAELTKLIDRKISIALAQAIPVDGPSARQFTRGGANN